MRLGFLVVLVALCSVWRMSAAQIAAPATSSAAPFSPEPVIQVPADETAFKAARGVTDPKHRKEAYEVFLRDFPKSKRAQTARENLLKTLFLLEPRDIPEIHRVAKAYVDNAAQGQQRSVAENEMAYDLAEALPHGADLKAAEAWSKDATYGRTHEVIAREMKDSSREAKLPPPSAELIHKEWEEERANNLQTLGNVYFAEGRLALSWATLDQGSALEHSDDAGIDALRGQIAHARHEDAEALDHLEIAASWGDLTEKQQALLNELYAAAHGGRTSGLEAEIDRRYAKFPQPFTPTPHLGGSSRHPVLVELYTGSGCPSCLAADFSVDGVLKAYPRSDVVVLAFDLHTPVPDPLANPDSIARAQFDGVSGVPSLAVGGQVLKEVDGDRSTAKSSFEKIEQAIDSQLREATGVTIQLTATLDSGAVATQAKVQVENAAALRQVLARSVAPDHSEPATKELKATSADTPASAEQTPKLVLNFALVQQVVRYSGTNAFRFHPMVVRALAKPSEQGFPVSLTDTSGASFRFDPDSISKGLASYLTGFEQHNDKFGTAHFRIKDTRLPLEQLAVAAWVEDIRTHRAVAAAYVSLQAQTKKAAR